MTVLVSFASERVIVMGADSAITHYFYNEKEGDYREYEPGDKAVIINGVGIVTTWGERNHNHLFSFLRENHISSETHSVIDLRNLVMNYLENIYRPGDDSLEEVGYHVGGFDREGNAKLYHLFWGFNRPRNPGEENPGYHLYDHSRRIILYNGRNDLANSVVMTFLSQIHNDIDTRYKLSTLEGMVQFVDFIMRFSAEVTPEVGPPFKISIVQHNQPIQTIINETLCPIDLRSDYPQLQKLFNEPLVIFPAEDNNIHAIYPPPTGVDLGPNENSDRKMGSSSTAGTITPF